MLFKTLLFNQMIHYIDELEKKDLKGKRVLLRLDLNVPISSGEIIDTYRLERVIETIDFLREKEAIVIIVSHCAGKELETLVPVWHYLNGYFPVDFCSTYFTVEATDKLSKLKNKEVLLFENIRVNSGETENNPEFAKKLSQMADIFVNDAFGESHRKYASIVGVPQFLPHFGGLLMRQEIEHLSKVFKPEHPFIFILGGAKFDTKFPIIRKYLDRADFVFVGGAIANDFFKEKGFEVGTSLVSKTVFDIGEILQNQKLILPIDVTCQRDSLTKEVSFKNPDEVTSDESIVDAGPKTTEQLKNLLRDAKTIVWNGPLGNYELGFKDRTESLAQIIISLTLEHGVNSIVGGGDTIASINKLNLGYKFSFISTGGGAMLDYLVDETLPGIDALKK